MAESMTGYGRAAIATESHRYQVEIKSINNRFCDVSVRMPRVLLSLESLIREKVQTALIRGKIDVFVTLEDTCGADTTVRTELNLALAYSNALSEIATYTGRPDSATSDVIARFPDVLSVTAVQWNPDTVKDTLFSVLDQAIEEILAMKRIEGEKLLSDVLTKLDGLRQMHSKLVARAPLVPAQYRERLTARMEELLAGISGFSYDEGRKEAEIAIFADKCAIDEELVRLDSHFSQLDFALRADGCIGKKLDFILQEINREINTIGSKANDITTTNLVVEMKTELEKIREQIQNFA